MSAPDELNKSVRETKSNEFAIYNNGITIVAEKAEINPDNGRPGTAQLLMHQPQLINGAQTAYTLAQIYEWCLPKKNFEVFKGKEVLLKIIAFVGKANAANERKRSKLIGDISQASNSQTKVEESDRRANDEIQRKIQLDFFDVYGLYYERKRGEFSDGMKYGYLPAELVINRERLVRVSLACEYRANQARSTVAKYFGEAELTTVLKVKDLAKYAYGYEVLARLDAERKRKTKPKSDP